MDVNEKVIFRYEEGDYREYRIPGIVITKKGTILCACEGRMSALNDWAAIDTLVMASVDGGKTWTSNVFGTNRRKPQTVPETVGNPTMIADGEKVHLLFCKNYQRMFYTVSEDEGISWMEPVEITETLQNASYQWNVCAAGPGHGISLNSGLLVAPIWLANGEEKEGRRIRAHWPSVSGVIVSEDRGKTWKMGALTEGIYDANETSIAEMSDGTVLLNVRHRGLPMHRVLARYNTVENHCFTLGPHKDLPDPMCYGGMVNLPGGKIAFVNCESKIDECFLHADDFGHDESAASALSRTNLTLKISADDGKTWKKAFTVDEVGGYADVAYHSGALYVLYERCVRGIVREMVLKTYNIVESMSV